MHAKLLQVARSGFTPLIITCKRTLMGMMCYLQSHNVSYVHVIYSHTMSLWYLQLSSGSQVVPAVGMSALLWEVLVKVSADKGEVFAGSAAVVWAVVALFLADCVLLSWLRVYRCCCDMQHRFGCVFCFLHMIRHHRSPVSCAYVINSKPIEIQGRERKR